VSWTDRLKEKWGIKSTGHVIVICIVFSLAGLSITQIKRVFWPLLGFTPETPFWLKVVAWLLLVFPTYQVMLMIFGTLLGQFRFFWEKEKKMFLFFSKPFRRKPSPSPEG